MKNKFKWKIKTIRTKILLGFSLIILMVAGLALYNYVVTSKVNTSMADIVERQIPMLILDEQLIAKMYEGDSLMRAYFLFHDTSAKEGYEQTIEEMEEIEKNIIFFAKSNETISTWESIIEKRKEWTATVNDAKREFDSGNKGQALSLLEEAKEKADVAHADIEAMVKEREENIYYGGQKIVSMGHSTIITSIIVALFVLISGTVVAIITSSSISRPIKLIMNRLNELAGGNLRLEPLTTNSEDEIAHLVAATNIMTENNRELINEIGRVSETVSSQSEELTQAANEVKVGTEQVAKTMEELAQGSETQADSASGLATMMMTFNDQVEDANNSGKHIEDNSKYVLEMTEKGSHLMGNSTKQMEKIDDIVGEAVEKMEILDMQSQKISQLVEVIKDVADQTNLLALNAAIEAARAGEQGKGFAVVADEVRKLAEQTALSVNDITEITTNIQTESSNVVSSLEEGYKEVTEGTEQIIATNETFNEIRTAVTEMVDNINHVSTSLANITAGSQEMSGSVEEIASVSEEAAAGVEQTAASAQQTSSSMDEIADSSVHLAELAERLNGLVGQFRV